jgi:hypothetical protein
MIRLFCQTRGYSNDVFNSLLSLAHRPYPIATGDGILSGLTPQEFQTAIDGIKRQGYHIFPTRLPGDLCDRLTAFALSAQARPVPRREGVPEFLRYDRDHPVAENYRFDEQTVLDSPDVQTLISDPSLIALAQAYLGLQPILDIVALWWSTSYAQTASSEAAQLFHFDMDRIKWLKIFFYLTEVTPQTGPHIFVAKSHRRKGQPAELLNRGYERIPDADIEKYYPKEDIIEIPGPRGMIFAADTRAFHKGKPLESGERLILQLEFCDSLFGAAYTQSALKKSYDRRLLSMAATHKRVYSKFRVEG